MVVLLSMAGTLPFSIQFVFHPHDLLCSLLLSVDSLSPQKPPTAFHNPLQASVASKAWVK